MDDPFSIILTTMTRFIQHHDVAHEHWGYGGLNTLWYIIGVVIGIIILIALIAICINCWRNVQAPYGYGAQQTYTTTQYTTTTPTGGVYI